MLHFRIVLQLAPLNDKYQIPNTPHTYYFREMGMIRVGSIGYLGLGHSMVIGYLGLGHFFVIRHFPFLLLLITDN